MKSYEELVTERLDAPFQGWDFSWMRGRSEQAEPSWSYDNIPLARNRLAPLGVQVRVPNGNELPARDGEFDLVLNPDGDAPGTEIARALRLGGRYLDSDDAALHRPR